MSLKETLENEKRHESDLQYKMSHQFAYIYLGISGALIAAFLILLSIDEKRFMGIGIAILILWGILTIAFLTAFSIIKRRIMTKPQEKDGAKHPARIKISPNKYNELRGIIAHGTLEKGRVDLYRFFLTDQLMNGDLQPAMVMSTSPLRIAVYSDEFDGTLLLSFPDSFASSYDLHEGDRLAATCAYYAQAFTNHGAGKDIFPGPKTTGKWADLLPVIPLFLAEDEAAAREKVNELTPELWEHASADMKRHYENFSDRVREGFWFTRTMSIGMDRNPIYEAER